jgi:hypothetical protein
MGSRLHIPHNQLTEPKDGTEYTAADMAVEIFEQRPAKEMAFRGMIKQLLKANQTCQMWNVET